VGLDISLAQLTLPTTDVTCTLNIYKKKKTIIYTYLRDPIHPVAGGDTTIDSSKYSVSKNPLTGLYYRLHILNVGMSDLKKHRCQTNVNGINNLLSSNPHCRTASTPCTTYTGVGFDSSLVQ
jgi:hypothetical protein